MKVFLNGGQVDHVIEANPAAGWVDVERWKDGKPESDNAHQILTERLHGKVEVMLTKEETATGTVGGLELPPPIDYQDLLKRYIRHVGDAEGATFIDVLNNHTRSDVKFTAEEVAELERLDQEGRGS